MSEDFKIPYFCLVCNRVSYKEVSQPCGFCGETYYNKEKDN